MPFAHSSACTGQCIHSNAFRLCLHVPLLFQPCALLNTLLCFPVSCMYLHEPLQLLPEVSVVLGS